jgi:hypothetical protein
MKSFYQVYESIALIYAGVFIKLREEDKDPQEGFWIVGKSLPVHILSSLYRHFVIDEIPTLESLDMEEKKRLWGIACKYQLDPAKRHDAAKAAYVLSLITNE